MTAETKAKALDSGTIPASKVKFGRKPSLTGHQREEALVRLANGEAQDVARSYNISQATILAACGA
jgi:hypothetical protein